MYGLVVIAVIMFGCMFLTNEKYQKEVGSGVFQAMLFNLLCCALGLPIMIVINGFRIEYTHFTLIMACIGFLNSVLCTVCTLKAFERVNLSVFSLLSMLGGMLLPLFAGIFFYGEKFTLGVGLCVAFVIAALLLTVNKGDKKKKGGFFIYAGVFVCNGMSGVISKIYTDASYPKATSAGYSILSAIVMAVVSLIFIVVLWKKRPQISLKSIFFGIASGPLSRVANWLLLIALTVLPASVNYPMVTGGTIIVSTLLSYFTPQKPRWREWLAVALSFTGIMLLTLLPI